MTAARRVPRHRRRPAVGRPAARAPRRADGGLLLALHRPGRRARRDRALRRQPRARRLLVDARAREPPERVPADGRASRGLGRPGGARRARGQRVRGRRRPADGRPRRGRAARRARRRDAGAVAAALARRVEHLPGRAGAEPVLASVAARRPRARQRDRRRRALGPRRLAGLRGEELGRRRLPGGVVVGPGAGLRGSDPATARRLRRVRRRQDPLRPAADRGHRRRRAAARRAPAAARRPGGLADARARSPTSRGRCARAARAGPSRSRAARRSAARTSSRSRCRWSAATCPGRSSTSAAGWT